MTKARFLMLFAVCLAWPSTAHAQWDFLDWLQPGSGPGPYRSSVGVFTRILCVKDDGGKHTVATCFNDTADDIKIVVDFHYGHVTSSNPRFNDPVAVLEPINNSSITIDNFDVDYSYRVSPLLDVGIGFGRYFYSGEGFATTARWMLTPVHISFVPLGYFRGDQGKKWGRVLRIDYWNRRIVGDTVAGDFGSKGSYVVRGEFSQGIAVGLDFWSFISDAVTKRK